MTTVTLYNTFNLTAFDFTAFADGRYYNRQQNYVNISHPVDGGLTDYYTAIGDLKFDGDDLRPIGGTLVGIATGYRVTGETPFTNETFFQQLQGVAILKLMKVGATDSLKDDAKLLADILKGDDFLIGSAAADTLAGFAGDDSFEGRGGGDVFLGGKGADLLSYVQATSGVKVDLSGGKTSGGFAKGDRFSSVENVDGGAFKDRISGDGRDNVIDGHGGADTLRGGDGADVFLFSASLDSTGADRIEDFALGEDQIGLRSGTYSLPSIGGKLPAKYYSEGKAASNAEDRLIYNPKTGQLFYDPDGTGAQKQTLIAVLDDHLDLGIRDFVVA